MGGAHYEWPLDFKKGKIEFMNRFWKKKIVCENVVFYTFEQGYSLNVQRSIFYFAHFKLQKKYSDLSYESKSTKAHLN